ncbi:MAG: hypothetical protein ACOC22_03695 [bacterium]
MEKLKQLKEQILQVNSDITTNKGLYGELLSVLHTHIKEHYKTIYEIYSRYDVWYLSFNKDSFNNVYDPKISIINIYDVSDQGIEMFHKFDYDRTGDDTTNVFLSWKELIDFNPIEYEYELCKAFRQSIFDEISKTHNKIHNLHKLIKETDVRYNELHKNLK